MDRFLSVRDAAKRGAGKRVLLAAVAEAGQAPRRIFRKEIPGQL